MTTTSLHACQSNINKIKTILVCLARLHGVLLLCTRLANDRPLSSSQAVWVWAWANALQYDSHYTPRWASCAPRLFLLLFRLPRTPNFLSLSLFICSSILLSHHPLLIFTSAAFAFYVNPFQLIYGRTNISLGMAWSHSPAMQLLRSAATSFLRWQPLDDGSQV